jgi:hypothetical protein
MPSAIYPKFLEQALQAGVNLSSANIKAVLVDLADYTYSSEHEFLTSVPGAARVATSANLGSKTFTNGTFDTADTVFTAVTGDQSEAIILYVDTGTEATSRLIVFRDAGVTGLPVTPNGGDKTVAVASGWFTLGST